MSLGLPRSDRSSAVGSMGRSLAITRPRAFTPTSRLRSANRSHAYGSTFAFPLAAFPLRFRPPPGSPLPCRGPGLPASSALGDRTSFSVLPTRKLESSLARPPTCSRFRASRMTPFEEAHSATGTSAGPPDESGRCSARAKRTCAAIPRNGSGANAKTAFRPGRRALAARSRARVRGRSGETREHAPERAGWDQPHGQ